MRLKSRESQAQWQPVGPYRSHAPFKTLRPALASTSYSWAGSAQTESPTRLVFPGPWPPWAEPLESAADTRAARRPAHSPPPPDIRFHWWATVRHAAAPPPGGRASPTPPPPLLSLLRRPPHFSDENLASCACFRPATPPSAAPPLLLPGSSSLHEESQIFGPSSA